MIFAFARFDLASWFPRRQTLLPLVFVVVVAIVLPLPGAAIVASAFVTSLMLSAPFLNDERNRLDTLYGVLPISRRTVVMGRALAVLAYAIVATAIAAASTFVVAGVNGREVEPMLLTIAYAAAFAILGLSVAVQLPVLFRVGYSRGRLVVYAPALLIAAGAWLGQATGVITTENVIALSVIVPIGVCAAIGAVGIAVGIALASRVYAKRELR